MTYQTIEKRLKKYNSNFFYFLKAHTKNSKAIIDTSVFSVEFLEEILKLIKKYKKGFQIEEKQISLINSVYINDLKGIIQIELSEIWNGIIQYTKG